MAQESVLNPIFPSQAAESPIIQAWDLKKRYRTGFWLNQTIDSLKGLSLTAYQGETFGLLGPNGAGKTTLLKILLGVIRPSHGRALILGQPIGDRPTKQRIGYLPENPYFYHYLTAWEFLSFIGGLFQIPRTTQRQRISELLDLVGLAKTVAKKKPMGKYSKGMLQRVGIAQSLINDPELVFFDEPMSGLDPIGRYQVRKIINILKQQGKTIFFNSHILADVEQICDRIAILANGQLLCSGKLNKLLGTAETYRVVLQGEIPTQLQHILTDISVEGSYCHGQLHHDPQTLQTILATSSTQLVSLTRAQLSLEEYFIQQLKQKGLYPQSPSEKA